MRNCLKVFLWFLLFLPVLTQNPAKGNPNLQAFEFEPVVIDAYFASFSYKLDDRNYALFLTEERNVEKLLVLMDKRPIEADTIIYPVLKMMQSYGKFVGYPFNSNEGIIAFDGLVPQKDYYLHLFRRRANRADTFELVSTVEFNTIAPEPQISATNLAFEDITDSSFVITWVNGDGAGRIVIVAESELTPPEDGKSYKHSLLYGKEASRHGSGFVVYDGNEPRPKIKITGLKPATKYYVAVYEYNGEGKYRNYRLEPASNNPRIRATKLQTPKIVKVKKLSPQVVTIKWEKVAGATVYLLDVALDRDFEQALEPYKDLDIGDLGEFELSDLQPKKKYYIRIKAKGPVGESLYSPVYELK